MEVLVGAAILVGGMILLLLFLVLISWEPIMWLAFIVFVVSLCYMVGYAFLHQTDHDVPTWNIITLAASTVILISSIVVYSD